MRKKWIAYLLALLLSVGRIPCRAAAAPTVSASVLSALPGDTLTFQVSISGNPGLSGFRLFLTYDTGAFAAETEAGSEKTIVAEKGAALPDGNLIASATGTGCQVFWYSTSESTQDGVLFSISLHVSDSAAIGTYPVKLSYAAYDTINAKEDPVSLSVQSGSVEIRNFNPLLYSENRTVKQGETFDFPVYLQDNPGFASCGLKLLFDSSCFELVLDSDAKTPAIDSGTDFSDGTLTAKPYSNGLVLLWYHTRNTTASGTFFTLRLRVKENALPGTQTIRLLAVPAQTLTENETPVSLGTRNAEITIQTSSEVHVSVSDAHTAVIQVDNSTAVYAVAAFYRADGQMVSSAMKTIQDKSAAWSMVCSTADLGKCSWKIFLLDQDHVPICEAFSASTK